jgi:digeranylgeranylglycerophospholipid reductase
MKDKIYDLIIIGAGPAGASLAYFLSDSNLKIALVEKKRYADRPVRCAELVPMALSMLYGDKLNGINSEVSHMETFIEGRLSNITRSQGYILDRDIFIDFLIKQFVKTGGEYLNSAYFMGASYPGSDGNNCGSHKVEESTINESRKSDNFDIQNMLYVKIRQKDRTFYLKTKILAGADGPCSQVAGIMRPMPKGACGFQENPEMKSSFLIGFQENITKKKEYENHAKIFFYPFLSGGYGWVFPKKESLNVGMAVDINALKENGLKNIYRRFKRELVENAVIEGSGYVNSTISGLAPVGGIKDRIVQKNIILIGDSAGLCNPITGAGNYNAAVSAKTAAAKIKTALRSDNMEVLNEAQKDIFDYFKTSIGHALKKRQFLEKNKGNYDFENLIKKTWVSFKDYWSER